jgi:hypothetical protein
VGQVRLIGVSTLVFDFEITELLTQRPGEAPPQDGGGNRAGGAVAAGARLIHFDRCPTGMKLIQRWILATLHGISAPGLANGSLLR